jgi:hypothetical protein
MKTGNLGMTTESGRIETSDLCRSEEGQSYPDILPQHCIALSFATNHIPESAIWEEQASRAIGRASGKP